MTPLALYLRAIKAITHGAESDVKRLPADADAYYAALPVIVETYGHAAALAASDFYDALRQGAGAQELFEVVFPESKDPGTGQLVGWALKTALTPETFTSLITAGVQKRVANFARETISENSYRDPKALGWMRIGTPDCGFCAELISRGSVYTERTAVFASHDNCDCLAVPAFDPSQVRKVNSEFVASARRISEASSKADRARSRKWIAENL